jgi:hypothetical protein
VVQPPDQSISRLAKKRNGRPDTVRLSARWQTGFWQAVQQRENSDPLRNAALAGRLGDWIEALTGLAVVACGSLGWQVLARWHQLDLLPMPCSEYLALDVMAFLAGA